MDTRAGCESNAGAGRARRSNEATGMSFLAVQQKMRDIDASIQVLQVENAAEEFVSEREVALRVRPRHVVDVANMTRGASAGP